MEDHIGHFLSYLSVEKGASVNTIAAYKNDLHQFRTYLSSREINGDRPALEALSKELILDYVLELRRKDYADATVARKVAAIKTFFGFLSEEGIVKRNPTESLSSPRVGKSLPKALSVQEMDELLEQPARRNSPEAGRDKAMLELLYATGMRVTELVSLDVDTVHLDRKAPYVRCLGKGAKERVIPIHEQAAEAVEDYLNDGRGHLVKNRDEPALFVNRRGERLTRQGFWLILKNYARAASIATPVTPHTLRHSFATHMLRGGAPLRNVQELLGHANIATTQVYTRVTSEHVRQVYEKAHPRAH
jgi:integrase/recombinase XerD